MADREFYRVLGVGRSASAVEIKQAYRVLARQLHPDHNQDDPSAEDRFKRVSYAYAVLSDPRKRKLYDRFGEVGLRESYEAAEAADGRTSRGPSDPGEAQRSRRAREEPRAEERTGFRWDDWLGGFRGRSQQRRGSDLWSTASLSFCDAVRGCERELRVRSRGGVGAKTLRVRIPAGVRDGERVRLRGLGRPASRGGERGDLWLTVEVAAHPCFFFEGEELHLTLPVSPLEAYEGATVDVPTPHGPVQLRIPAGTESGAKLRLRAKGVVRGQSPAGDLIAHVRIEWPRAAGLRDAYRALHEALGGDVRRTVRFD